MGFKVPQSFFCRIASMAKARKKPRVSTSRTTTPGLCVCDFKGPFVPAKHGGETSVIGFKLPNSGFVHEVYLQRQTVLAAVDAFDEFRDLARVRFGIVIDTLLFDRDTAFNKSFRRALLTRDVCPDMSGVYDHYELGSIETYWVTWQTLVSAFLLHGKKDESHWKFAAKMANHILMRLLTSANPGFVSPLEALTNETPDLSDLIAPFSPSHVIRHPGGHRFSFYPRARRFLLWLP
jgi:hypothetical protein